MKCELDLLPLDVGQITATDPVCHCSVIQDSTPFAVIGSNTVVEARGQRVRGRLYPWGIVEGEQRCTAGISEVRLPRQH